MQHRKQIRRNPIARALRDPMFHTRVVKSKTVYNRKTARKTAQTVERD